MAIWYLPWITGGDGGRTRTSRSPYPVLVENIGASELTSHRYLPLLLQINIILFLLACSFINNLGKTYIKKSVFLVVEPLKFYPSYTNGLVVHAVFIEKRCFFCLVVEGGGVYPLYTLSSQTTKKTHFFLCVSSLISQTISNLHCSYNFITAMDYSHCYTTRIDYYIQIPFSTTTDPLKFIVLLSTFLPSWLALITSSVNAPLNYSFISTH